MAKMKSGPTPWSEGYRRATKKSLQSQGMEWSLSSGYRKRPDGWDSKPEKPKMKRVRLYNGRTVEVPDADYEDFIGHHVSKASDPMTEIGQYIDKAFENPARVQDVDGVGHISYIEYVPTYQILRVEFANDGAVVVFFRVPKEVYSELKYLAQTKQTSTNSFDGTQRHVLGMRFWDIVRIRGQLHNARYKFEYAIEGERTGSAYMQDLSKERKESDAAHKNVANESEQMYDNYARNMLSGKQRDEYNKLKNVEDKEKYLVKAGIL